MKLDKRKKETNKRKHGRGKERESYKQKNKAK
jgi:hypothetical protein